MRVARTLALFEVSQHPLVIFNNLLEAQAELIPPLYLGEDVLRDIGKGTFVPSHSF